MSEKQLLLQQITARLNGVKDSNTTISSEYLEFLDEATLRSILHQMKSDALQYLDDETSRWLQGFKSENR